MSDEPYRSQTKRRSAVESMSSVVSDGDGGERAEEKRRWRRRQRKGRTAAGTVDSVEAGGGHPGVRGRGPISMAHRSSPPKLITLV
ncbi:hypothetical protein BHE74_00004413 [Ensete ventricosum]|nr:hypothetical protein GW17_00016883 [Ensete ventricosum]RWW86786.1 hypothetical protein BHE74_00004413 [Ensete ventricosum]RZR90226.1 hypothetical protein BHM03_00018086 [Ensete ventricosum]